MVSAHLWLKAYSVRTAPQGPGGHVRYLRREGEFAPVHYVNRTSPRTKDYTDFVEGHTRNLPEWAGGDASYFFTQSFQYERSNGAYAYQLEISLPRELTHEQHQALTVDFMDAVLPDLPALWVKHNKQLENGEMHPHIHILFSARKMDGIDRGPEQMFKRWNRDNPERGGCEKDRFWNQRQAPEQIRQAFADITNYHLEREHAVERLDVRALKRRGSQRQAQRWKDQVPLDPATKAREQAQAIASWDQRKAYKGLDDLQAIPREEFVLLVREWTREFVRGTAVERSPAEVVQAWQQKEAARLLRETERQDAYLQTLEAHLQIIQQARAGQEVPMRALVAALAAGEEQGPRGGLTMRLTEEQGYGR